MLSDFFYLEVTYIKQKIINCCGQKSRSEQQNSKARNFLQDKHGTHHVLYEEKWLGHNVEHVGKVGWDVN